MYSVRAIIQTVTFEKQRADHSILLQIDRLVTMKLNVILKKKANSNHRVGMISKIILDRSLSSFVGKVSRDIHAMAGGELFVLVFWEDEFDVEGLAETFNKQIFGELCHHLVVVSDGLSLGQRLADSVVDKVFGVVEDGQRVAVKGEKLFVGDVGALRHGEPVVRAEQKSAESEQIPVLAENHAVSRSRRQILFQILHLHLHEERSRLVAHRCDDVLGKERYYTRSVEVAIN